MKTISLFLLSALFWVSQISATELVVYSARNEQLIKPVFDAYTKETGVKIKYITGKNGLIVERLRSEGRRSPADILLTVDAGNLWHASELGLLHPVKSSVLEQNIPLSYRDPKGLWFGISLRARTIVYSTDRVNPNELSTYEDLAGAKWKGRLLLRTSKKVYNQSLVAMLLDAHGKKKTAQLMSGWVNNLATKVYSNDTKLMQGILAGKGDLGIVNTYYFGRLKRKNPDIKLALFWPNQNDRGVHVNVSGAAVTKSSKQKEEAQKFIEWLTSNNAQKLFAELNMEYPVREGVKLHKEVASWGDFKKDNRNLAIAGAKQKMATQIMQGAEYW